MNKEELFTTLACTIKNISEMKRPASERLRRVCELLQEAMPNYDWVGFYIADPKGSKELILGPYAGDSTEHDRIQFGDGVCGRAAEQMETIVVDDVCEEENYIACSPDVQSEIVVPIVKNEKLLGEIDVDSFEVAAFSDEDAAFLLHVGEVMSGVIGEFMEDVI